MRRLLFLFILFANVSCAYRWGFRERAVPGGYRQVAVPIFKNKTQEVGIENDFTNALIRQFERSQVAHIASKDVAPVRIDGTIETLVISGGAGGLQGGTANNPLPTDAVLRTEYKVVVMTRIQVRRQSDEKIIWEGAFSDQKNYQAPRIGEPIVNSANATYNQSMRHFTVTQLAEEMMSDAHDRITENF